MIAVIADDLSGAAEIAGLALRYQLSVEMTTAVVTQTDADVLVVSTDSRSMSESEAVSVTREIVRQLIKLKPELIYKKVDSVLRGHILEEIEVQLQEMKLNTALLIPANPSLGRTIENGKYFVQGKPINETAFAKDPEFGVTNADVISMVKGTNDRVSVIKQDQSIPTYKIVIGEVSSKSDLQIWASANCNKEILFAGAGDFFIELMEAKKAGVHSIQESFTKAEKEFPYLMVSGTSFTQNAEAIKQLQMAGGPVCYMPVDIYSDTIINQTKIENWKDEIIAVLQKNNAAVIAIDGSVKNAAASYLRTATAACIKKIMDTVQIKELYIEGGATAAAIIDQLGITKFYPETELARGVVRMRVAYHHSLYITIKPGSYPHPAGVFSFHPTDTKAAI